MKEPVRICATLDQHEYILSTVALLAYLHNYDPNATMQIIDDGLTVLKEDTVFNIIKWCGEQANNESPAVG